MFGHSYWGAGMFGPGYWGPPLPTTKRGGRGKVVGAKQRWYVQQALAEERDHVFRVQLREERRRELSREFRRAYEQIVAEQRHEAEVVQRHVAMVAVLLSEA